MDFTSDETTAESESIVQSIRRELTTYLSGRRRYFILLVAVFLIGNIVLPEQVEQTGGSVLPIFLVGALTAQIGLLASFPAMSSNATRGTITVSILMLLFVWASYIVGLQIADSNQLPVEPAIFLFGLALFGFAVTYLCLRQLSLRSKYGIRHVDDLGLWNAIPQPISIRFMMSVTAVIALAICVIKLCLPDKSAGWPPKLGMMLIGCALIVGFSLIIFAATIFIGLGRRFYWRGLAVLIMAILVIPWAYAFSLQMLTRERIYSDLHWSYGYVFGHAFFSFICCVILRAMGYQLVKFPTEETMPVSQREL